MKEMKEIKNLTEKELKALCKKKGMRNADKKSTDKLIAFLEMKERIAKELQEAQEYAMVELGVHFNTACMMFMSMNNKKSLTADDFYCLPDDYEFAKKLVDVDDVLHSGTSIHKIAEACRKRYFYNRVTAEEVQAMTEEEALVFIQNIKDFYINAHSSGAKPKSTYSVIKMDMGFVNEDGTFDSSKAIDLTGAEIKESLEGYMRKVLTCEDGIYRYIKQVKGPHYDEIYNELIKSGMSPEQASYEAKGLNMVSIDYNVDPQSPQVAIKEYITRNGLIDIATGDKYIFLKCTPSESRKGTVTFICQKENRGWQETFEYWYTFTGTKTFKGFAEALGEPVEGTQNSYSLRLYNECVKPEDNLSFEEFCNIHGLPICEYKFNLAKMMTRLASQGSNSFNSNGLMDEEMYNELKNTKVLIVPDRKLKLKRHYKTWNKECTDLVEKDDIIKLVAGDGQMLGSPEFHARITRMLEGISTSDYSYYLEVLKKYNNDIQLAGRKDITFKKIQKRIYSVIQGRGGKDNFLSFKGISVMVDFKKFVVTLSDKLAKQLNKLNGTNFKRGDVLELKDYDVICPQSVAKFVVVDSKDHEFKWDVCNFNKVKGEWVCMNPQFIASLNAENPNLFTPILKFWCDKIDKSFDDISTLLHLMNIIKHSGQNTEAIEDIDDVIDEEEESVDTVDIATMIMSNDKWKHDPYILGLVKDKIEKFVNEMSVGRIRVPGVYTYMVQDPYRLLQMYFGIKDMKCALKKGQFYFNNKDCRAGLFRSPLVAPFQAQAVQLVENNYYWMYRDVIVFNAVDGVWDLMGGADFDGDTCAVVPEDDANGFGKLIIDAIRQNQTIVYAPTRGAKEVIWNPDNYEAILDYVNGIGRDNTGIFTNYATRLLALANHLRGLIFMCNYYGVDKITFCHPEAFGREKLYGTDYSFNVANGQMETRGIVPCVWDRNSKKFVFLKDSNSIVGTYTIDEVESLAEQKTVRNVNIMTIVQMEEIDGAKTGYHPVPPQECVYTQNPAWMIARQKFLGRLPQNDNKFPEKFSVSGLFSTLETTKTKMYNTYRSFDMMGRIYEFVYKRRTEIFKRFEQGGDKIAYLKSLMTDEERNQINMMVSYEGKQMTLLELLQKRKSMYATSVRNLKNMKVDKSTEFLTLANLKYKEVMFLKSVSKSLNVSMTVIAYGCYLATYGKDDKQNNSLSYAWLLWPELASISSRDNCSFELFSVPSNAEDAYVLSNALFVNGKKFANVNAEAGPVEVQRFGGTRAYVLLHKINGNAVVNRNAVTTVYSGAKYEIGVYGFGYANREAKSVDDWKRIVKENDLTFYILEDNNGNLCTSVIDENGNPHHLAQLVLPKKGAEGTADLELKGKKVKITTSPNYRDTNENGKKLNSISGICVRVI